MKEPKLRFKADDGSDFPDWEEKKLGKLTEKINRRGTNSTADIRMISQGNGFILQSDKYSRENAGESLKKYTLLKKNEFAYNHGASKMKPYGVCYRLCESDEARVPYVYHTFRFISEIEDFWNYALNTSKMDRQLKKIVSSGARMDGLLNIGYDAYMSVSVMVPSLPEQQKIADFLSTIDTIIEKQRATVSAWEERKKGVMQKLFSQEVRFKADDGSDFPDWEEKEVKDVCSVSTGKSNTQDKVDSGKYEFYVRSPIVEHSDKYLFDEEAVITVGDGVGTGKVFHYVNGKYNLHQRCYRMYDFMGVIGKYFFYFFSQNFYRRIKAMSAKTSVDSVRMEMITKMKMNVPSLPEQQKIADCLSALDTVIEKQKETLEKWQELKKGLLQQMFV